MIYLTEEEHEELRKKAFNKKISMSGLVKHLLKFGNNVENNITKYKKELEDKKPKNRTSEISKEFGKQVGSGLRDEGEIYPQPKKGKKK